MSNLPAITNGGLQLRHYTAEPEIIVPFTVQQSPEHRLYTIGKPAGLWVSVPGEDDWPNWCRDNDYRVETLAHEHVVTLTPQARILHLSHEADIMRLDREYGQETGPLRRFLIDYVRLQREGWHGIIIAPYQWGPRLELMWYYAWDCASGCIWDADAIASVELVKSDA
jgi:hypothetical protein